MAMRMETLAVSDHLRIEVAMKNGIGAPDAQVFGTKAF